MLDFKEGWIKELLAEQDRKELARRELRNKLDPDFRILVEEYTGEDAGYVFIPALHDQGECTFVEPWPIKSKTGFKSFLVFGKDAEGRVCVRRVGRNYQSTGWRHVFKED